MSAGFLKTHTHTHTRSLTPHRLTEICPGVLTNIQWCDSNCSATQHRIWAGVRAALAAGGGTCTIISSWQPYWCNKVNYTAGNINSDIFICNLLLIYRICKQFWHVRPHESMCGTLEPQLVNLQAHCCGPPVHCVSQADLCSVIVPRGWAELTDVWHFRVFSHVWVCGNFSAPFNLCRRWSLRA